MKLVPTIGLEIHVQLGTKTKMFCRCSAEVFGEEPNTHTCPVCLGLPGALPIPNAEAIRLALLAGEALASKHPETTRFDRKNYYYPDLPKGYQITQFDAPLNLGGEVVLGDRRIKITRAHLEEDTGKLLHQDTKTLVDYNRSGLPLLEIVSDPMISSAEEAKSYGQKVQQLMRYAGVSEADMEKGSLRVDANVSVSSNGSTKLGSKVEVKNMNSFRSVERALKYEIERQTSLLEKGGKIVQETRGWDEAKSVTVGQRSKEESHDYRYFPEPDLKPIKLTREVLDEIRKKLPEMPAEKQKRFISQFGMDEDMAVTLTADKYVADVYEDILVIYGKLRNLEGKEATKQLGLRVGNFIRRDVLSFVNSGYIKTSEIDAPMVAELFIMIYDGELPANQSSNIALEMFERKVMPRVIAQERGLGRVQSDLAELGEIAKAVVEKNTQAAQDVKAGKMQAFGFLVGQIMKETNGQADPKIVKQALEQALAES